MSADQGKQSGFRDKSKPEEIRNSNIQAAKGQYSDACHVFAVAVQKLRLSRSSVVTGGLLLTWDVMLVLVSCLCSCGGCHQDEPGPSRHGQDGKQPPICPATLPAEHSLSV